MNAALPDIFETQMMDCFTDGDIQKAIDPEPVGRLCKPKGIAEAMLWMASDLGGFEPALPFRSMMPSRFERRVIAIIGRSRTGAEQSAVGEQAADFRKPHFAAQRPFLCRLHPGKSQPSNVTVK